MIQITKLASGLTIITAEMPHRTSVSLGVWVGVGGRYEPASVNGVSHFIEHMLFKGTRRRNAREISEAVEGVGGYLNAFTSEEHTCFYARAGVDHVRDVLDVLLDMFLDSRFAKAEIDKERDVIKEELAMILDQPQQQVQEVLNETLWPKHPLGRAIGGTPQTLDQIRRTELLQFQATHYVASSTVIAAAGAVHHQDVVRAVRPHAKRFRTGTRPAFMPIRDSQSGPRLKGVTKATEQTQLALGVRACSRHDPRLHALRLLNIILGENTSSRLWQVLREDWGLAYHISSSISGFDDVGTLDITAGVEIEKGSEALRRIIREMRRLTETAPARAEVRRACDYACGQLDLSLENTEDQMMWLGERYLSFGRVATSAEIKRQLHEVTPADIRRAACDFFRSDRVSLALVSPRHSTAAFKKELSPLR